MLPIKKELPAAVPSGVNTSNTNIALAGTVGGEVRVAVNNVPNWSGIF